MAEHSSKAGQAETDAGAAARSKGSIDPTLALPPGTKPGSPEAAAGPAVTQLGVYELVEKLGQGGMGAVWKARHTKLDKLVALKILPPHLMSDEHAVARFEREMKAVGKLEHPHIVRAMDAGEAAGVHYLVMEYVEGTDLAKLVQTRGPRPVGEACQMIRHAALGLAHAHEHGMVHRDIKPSNLLLWKKGLVKILDLGLARLATERSAGGEALTGQGEILGTPDYMAPEQWNSPNLAGPPADLYALGCTLVFLLTGRHLFGDEQHSSYTQKMKGHLLEAPPRLMDLRGDVPQELDALCKRLLAKLPEDRPQSAKQLAGEIQGMLKRWSKTAPASDAIAWTPPAAVPPPAPAAPTPGSVALKSGVMPQPVAPQSPPAGRSMRTIGLAAAGIAVVLLMAVGIWYANRPPAADANQELNAANAPPQAEASAGETPKTPAHVAESTPAEDTKAVEQARKLYDLGRELCFVKDDWKLGLPLLAQGHDPGVRAAAEMESQNIVTFEDKVKVGKLWLTAGQNIKDPADDNWHCYRRSRYWLKQTHWDGPGPANAPWWKEAADALDLLPVLRAPLLIKVHGFNSEFITIRRNEIEWISHDGAGPNEISSVRTGVALPKFHSKYPGEDRHVFGREEVRKILPEGVDFTLARIRVNQKSGKTAPYATAVILPERSNETQVTIRVAEWDGRENKIASYQGDFTFEIMLGFSGEAAGKRGR